MPYKDKNKTKEYQKTWVADRKKEFFKGKICSKCGSTEDLQLHHINPEEKESHKIWSWSEERRKTEIAKCNIMCKSCHTEYHAEKKRKPIIHGDYNSYKKGCRCILCKEARKLKAREYRLKLKMNNVSKLSELKNSGAHVPRLAIRIELIQ